MAIAEMKRLAVLAPKKDKRVLLDTLANLGCVEVAAGEAREKWQPFAPEGSEDAAALPGRIEGVFHGLQALARQAKALKIPFSLDTALLNETVDAEELRRVFQERAPLVERLTRAEEVLADVAAVTAAEESRRAKIKELTPYLAFETPFYKLTDTRRVAVRYGLVHPQKWQAAKGDLPENAETFESAEGGATAVALLFLKEDAEAVEGVLRRAEFQRAQLDSDFTARAAIAEEQVQLDALARQKAEKVRMGAEFAGDARDWKRLCDACLMEREKGEALGNTLASGRAFLLEGWCPADCCEDVLAKLAAASPSAYLEVRDPREGEDAPAQMRENPVVRPFGNNITAMFGAPRYGGVDPNPFVALFYFLFFGFMLGDAGYGVLLTLAGTAYVLIKKPVRKGSMIAMFAICGLSTIFWGAIFGSWFAISEETMMGNALGRFLMSLKCIDPLSGSETLIMFGLALVLGGVQISVGYAINGTTKLRKNPLDGILNNYSWVLIFVGIAFYLLYALLHVKGMNIAGLVIALVGLVMLLAGGALGKRNPLAMVVGAFKNLYGGINVFSDLLSYARLFGLGLTTGVIGLVVNRIGMIFVDLIGGPAAYIPAVLVWLVGHTFNFAINLLGVYVHNSRLQFVEFFGKFYDGDGRFFRPLGSAAKYNLVREGAVHTPKRPAKHAEA